MSFRLKLILVLPLLVTTSAFAGRVGENGSDNPDRKAGCYKNGAYDGGLKAGASTRISSTSGTVSSANTVADPPAPADAGGHAVFR